MSIKSAFESEGIDFSQVMNPPEPWDGINKKYQWQTVVLLSFL